MSSKNQTPMLRSKDNKTLLDTIDLLRNYGVNRYVPLPQLIVVGDQSSGKSSVLEAVSGVKFPIKDSLCTRFATELILRRRERETVKVSIAPAEGRNAEEAERLKKFRPSKSKPTIADIPEVIEDAKKALGITEGGRALSNDVLKVDISGPSQPDLTIVDLPGLIHAKSEQTEDGDEDLISSLVLRYMNSSRSIILAVVSAKSDYALQVITKRAREADPQGLRTLGIITKPDTLDAGSGSERDFADLLHDGGTAGFGLGWHALRNRDFTTRDCTDGERDELEADFFSKGVWSDIPADRVGIHTLRPRLGQILEDQIVAELPSLASDVEVGIQECRRTLSRLGEARSTTKDQQRYLIDVGEAFRHIISAAANGYYNDPYFGSVEAADSRKRLRAVVQENLLAFAKDMQSHGHKVTIVETHEDKHQSSDLHEYMTWAEFVAQASMKMQMTRGSELPGTFNPSFIGDLFFEQAQPWTKLSKFYGQEVLAAVLSFIENALAHVSDESTKLKLQYHIIQPAMDDCAKTLDAKLDEILRLSKTGHPITYNHYFSQTIQSVRNSRAQEQALRQVHTLEGKASFDMSHVEKALQGMSSQTISNVDFSSASEAVHCMEAYYQVARTNFIDNFAILAVEYCVMEKLATLFTAQTVMDLKEDILESIAGETEKTKVERSRAAKKLKSLEAGLQALRSVQRQKPLNVKNPFLETETPKANAATAEGNTHDRWSDSTLSEA